MARHKGRTQGWVVDDHEGTYTTGEMPAESSSPGQTQFRLAEIDINLSPSDEKITGLFRIDSEQRGKKGPVLIILAEIASTLYVYEQLLDALEQAAEQTRHLLSAVDTDSVVRFEKITEKLNEAIANFIKQEPTPVVWNRVNLFVMEFSDHVLCLTGMGRMCSIFLQKQKDGQLKAFDLFGSLEQPAEVNPEKPFASLICGDMHPGDILFAGTLNFERLRQELQIKERLQTLPAVTACLEIRQDLERRGTPDQFCALVATNAPVTNNRAIPVAELPVKEADREPTDSVQKLHEEALKTESILSPTVTPLHDMPAPASAWKDRLLQLHGRVQDKVQELRAPKHPSAPVTRDPLTLASLRGMNAGHGSLFTDERKKKLGAFVVVAILVIGGGTWLYRARQFAAEQELWNTSLNQAIDRKNRAEGDLVYNNEDRARSLIKEATTLVAPLDESTPERRAAKQKFLQELQVVQNKLKHEVSVQPTTVYTANGTSGLSTLSLLGDNLVSVDNPNHALVLVAPATKASKTLILPSESPRILSATTNNNTLILFGEDHTVLLAEPSKEKVGLIPFTFTNASSVQAAQSYNGRVYVLDPAKNMIWRYTANGTSYSQERAYLKTADAALSQGTSLAIDSNIYIGLQNGQIKRYLSGKESSWSLRSIDPPVTNIQALWASADSDRLVILDQIGKRILVVTKDGTLITQLTSPSFTDLRSLTVDPKTKKIYVVNGSTILEVDLP